MKFPFVHTVNLFMQKRKSFGHQGTRFTKGQFISKGKTAKKILKDFYPSHSKWESSWRNGHVAVLPYSIGCEPLKNV